MQSFLQFLIIGLGAGAAYALFAQGAVLIYRGSGLVNFAQGAIGTFAAYIAFEAVTTLLAQEHPDASPVGIVLTSVSIAVMLWLARAKRRVAGELGSRALAADAEQTQACWYLSVVVLVGIGLNALFGWWWADPVAALGVVVLLVREGREAWEGEDHD